MRHLTWSLLAAGLVLAGSGTSQGQDTVRLGGPTAQAEIDGGADVAFVRGGRGGYGGGHYGGYAYGGYRGGYGYGYGGYRGYGYGGYRFGYGRGYYGYGYGLGYGYYWPYYGYGYGYYAPPVYYNQPYIYYNSPSYYYYPISGTAVSTRTVQANASYSEQLPPPGSAPMMPPANDGTFPYDGGPRSPVPMPGPGEKLSPARQQRSTVPVEGKLASMPNEISMGSYLLTAFETPAQTKSPPAPRTGYAAYGEDPVTAPARKR